MKYAQTWSSEITIMYNLTLGKNTKDSCGNGDISGSTVAWHPKKYGSISGRSMKLFIFYKAARRVLEQSNRDSKLLTHFYPV